MKLYYSPGACSLACRISLHEAGLAFDYERVDLKTKTTEHGHDYRAINPKGYVPMLVLDDGATITENDAVLDYIAGLEPKLGVQGSLGRTRLIEMLTYLSTELHAAFKPLWHDASEVDKSRAREAIAARLAFLATQTQGDHLFGPDFTVADAYLFVMLRWARGFGVPLPSGLARYFDRILARATVRRSLAEERLTEGGAGPILTMVPD
jgi:glutathione S-transferase